MDPELYRDLQDMNRLGRRYVLNPMLVVLAGLTVFVVGGSILSKSKNDTPNSTVIKRIGETESPHKSNNIQPQVLENYENWCGKLSKEQYDQDYIVTTKDGEQFKATTIKGSETSFMTYSDWGTNRANCVNIVNMIPADGNVQPVQPVQSNETFIPAPEPTPTTPVVIEHQNSQPENNNQTQHNNQGICGQITREQTGWQHRFEVTKSNGEVVEATFAGNPNHFTVIPQWGKRFGCDEAIGYQQIK